MEGREWRRCERDLGVREPRGDLGIGWDGVDDEFRGNSLSLRGWSHRSYYAESPGSGRRTRRQRGPYGADVRVQQEEAVHDGTHERAMARAPRDSTWVWCRHRCCMCFGQQGGDGKRGRGLKDHSKDAFIIITCVPLSSILLSILFIYSHGSAQDQLHNPPRSNVLPSNSPFTSSSALPPSTTSTLCTPRSRRVVLRVPPSSQSSAPPSSRTTSSASLWASLQISPPWDTLGACFMVCFCDLRPRAVGAAGVEWDGDGRGLSGIWSTGDIVITSDHTNYDMQRNRMPPSPPLPPLRPRPRNASRTSKHARPFLARPHPHPLAPPLSLYQTNTRARATVPQAPACPSPRTDKVVTVHVGRRGRARGAGVHTPMWDRAWVFWWGWGSGRNSIGGWRGSWRG